MSLAAKLTADNTRTEIFEYPLSPGAPETIAWEGFAAEVGSGRQEANQNALADAARRDAVFEKRIAEETKRAFEAGLESGRQEGRKTERDAQAAAKAAFEARRVHQATELIAKFAEERDRYLRTVEQEVVKLALAVAARILRREAQMDPLLLTGAVRVALGQLSASTEARLRVPAGEAELWTDAVTLLPNLGVKAVVVADEAMRLGDCKVDTELGSVDLGIRSQLGEIERGFFDRAGSLPRQPAAETQHGAAGVER